MEIVVLFGIIVLVVFAGAFVTARRFGVLALGLAAGSVLAGLWADVVAGRFMQFSETQAPWVPAGVVANVALLIAPVLLLLLSGPRYYGKADRVLSAAAIGVLTAAFLVRPLGKFMLLEGQALAVYGWLEGAWHYVVTVGLVLGVIDLFLLHSSRKADPKSDGKKH